MSERGARAIEVASIVVIGLAVAMSGWALLQNLARFRLASSVLLLILAAVQLAALRRNSAGGGYASRVRATRDVAFIAAILVALTYLLTPLRWAVGTSVSLVEFAIVLELLARLGPAPADSS